MSQRKNSFKMSPERMQDELVYSGILHPEYDLLANVFARNVIFKKYVGLLPCTTFKDLSGDLPVVRSLVAENLKENILSVLSADDSADVEQWLSFAYGHQVEAFLKTHSEDFTVLLILQERLKGRSYLAHPLVDVVCWARLASRLSALTPSQSKVIPDVIRWSRHMAALCQCPLHFEAINILISKLLLMNQSPIVKVDGKVEQTGPNNQPKCQPSDDVSAKNSTPKANNPKTSLIELADLRVGKIIEIARHPSADRLYVERVDFGPSIGVKTVVSGLVQAFPDPGALQGRMLPFIVNLKPATLQGVRSEGMLFVAKAQGSSDQLNLIQVPECSQPGDPISLQLNSYSPSSPLKDVLKVKDWDALKPKLIVHSHHASYCDERGEYQKLLVRGQPLLIPDVPEGILS